MVNKTAIPDCIAEKINFDAVHSQDDLNTAISQAYDACAKENKVRLKDQCDCTKGEKKKREPSEYNTFIKDCFKTKSNPTLTDCAADWRKGHPKK